jgi:hypothetical protein
MVTMADAPFPPRDVNPDPAQVVQHSAVQAKLLNQPVSVEVGSSSVKILMSELRLTADPDVLDQTSSDQVVTEIAKAVARDLGELAKEGDRASENPFLAVRDGRKRGNREPIKVHATCTEYRGIDDGSHVYVTTVVIS